jgi:hypothetical protein
VRSPRAAAVGSGSASAASRSCRRPDHRRFRWLFALDTLLVVGVVSLSAGLTSSGPHEGQAGHPGAHAGHGGWAGTGVLPMAGPWEATVRVRVDAFREVAGSCRLDVGEAR